MKRTDIRKVVSTIAARGKLTVAAVLLLTSAAVATALACGWSLVTDHSVRFNTYRAGRAFYRLPPLPIMVDDTTGKELSVREVENYYGDESNEYDTPSKYVGEKSWQAAHAAVSADELEKAGKLFREYLAETASPTFNDDPRRQLFRNSAFDMLDALTSLGRGSRPDSVKKYLEARYALLNGQAPEPTDEADRNLKDNWDYLHAAWLYSNDKKPEALAAFRDLASKYPRSEKRESVEYMIAKLIMEASSLYEGPRCEAIKAGPPPADDGKTERPDPGEQCRKQDLEEAAQAFRQFLSDHPNGRLVNDARGWIAHLSDGAESLAEYYRLLGHPTDRAARLNAKRSLQFVGHEQTDETLDKVEALIADDPNAALAYAYHRIYNHAVDLSYQEFDRWCCWDEATRWDDERKETQRVADSQSSGRRELERVARFATAMMKRHRQTRVSGAFVLRVAQAQLELQNFTEARDLSRKAMSIGLGPDHRAEALWVEGSSRHALKDLAGSRTVLNRLVTEFPNSKLVEGARRLIAIAAEDADDLESALDQFLALGYEYDVAYYVDVLMPTDRLAKFANARPAGPQRDLLLYSLGLRRMREKRWDEARAALRQVRTEPGTPDSSDYYMHADRAQSVKEPDWGAKQNAPVRTEWVMQDLKTIDTLEHLERAVDAAADDEAKAEAMYQLASFEFDADKLLYYNPAIWGGQRYWLLSDLDQSSRFRLPNESQVLFDYSQSHETLARAIPVYLEIVTRFPKTRAARDAMYTAAVAHEHLSNLNPYWRSIYGRGLYAGPRHVGYNDVRNAFPGYQLPRGTNGWEASTRTVNGGPGWAAKPKPAPPLTRTQKFERLLDYASGKLRSWLSPWAASFTGTVTSIFNGYISLINACLGWMLPIVGILLSGYFALLCIHFRGPLLAAARRMTGPGVPAMQFRLPWSGSRVEKMIDHTDPGEGEK